MLIENLVAQCLRANGHQIFFHIARNAQTRKVTMAVDFLVQHGQKVMPINVKSAHSANLLSLARYKEKFGDQVADGVVLHHSDVTRKRHINYLPYYMATVL